MHLVTPEANSPAETMLDWLELRVILNKGNEVSYSDLVDARNEEDGNFDSATEDELRDDIISKLGYEYSIRSQSLRDAYPFVSDGMSLAVSPSITPGGWSYILCLRLSLVDTGLAMSGTIPDITDQEQSLFQLCSNYAAAGYLGGKSISFGWPRRNNPKFIPALTDAYHNRIKEGKVRQEFLSGQASRVKDDEIDIIAFKPSNDGWPNQFAMFGQVASGSNWVDKPLSLSKINSFHKKWFEEAPQLVSIHAIFIPFCPYSEIRNRQGLGAMRRHYMEKGDIYGLLFTRYRIPLFVDKGIELGQKQPVDLNIIDELGRLPELEAWGRVFIEQRGPFQMKKVRSSVG